MKCPNDHVTLYSIFFAFLHSVSTKWATHRVIGQTEGVHGCEHKPHGFISHSVKMCQKHIFFKIAFWSQNVCVTNLLWSYKKMLQMRNESIYTQN